MASHFIDMVEAGTRTLSIEATVELNSLDVDEMNVGDPAVFVDGRLGPFFDAGVASLSGITEWLRSVDELWKIDYPAGLAWGSVFAFVATSELQEKPTKDYSSYRKIVLELKGSTGGERVYFAMKDQADPDDGSESVVPITLGSEWQIYEIDLSEFATADLSILHQVALFIFRGEEPVSIAVRKIQFAD